MKYKLLNLSAHKYIKHFLTDVYLLTNGDSSHIYGCVPNGEIGISVVLHGDGTINVDGKWCRQPKVSVYGLVRKVQFHEMTPGYCEINIGFQPEFLQLFIRERVSNLLKRQATDLYDLMPAHEVNRLHEELSAAQTEQKILDTIDQFLERNLLAEHTDKRILHCLDLIRNGNATNVNELGEDVNVSATTLRTMFNSHVGISPKDLVKIHRVKRALMRMTLPEENMTQTAYSLGYYDQSHFIHEFRDTVGLTPKQYFANKDLTFDFYNFQRWRYDSFASIKID